MLLADTYLVTGLSELETKAACCARNDVGFSRKDGVAPGSPAPEVPHCTVHHRFQVTKIISEKMFAKFLWACLIFPSEVFLCLRGPALGSKEPNAVVWLSVYGPVRAPRAFSHQMYHISTNQLQPFTKTATQGMMRPV